jgi:hypothetical protein
MSGKIGIFHGKSFENLFPKKFWGKFRGKKCTKIGPWYSSQRSPQCVCRWCCSAYWPWPWPPRRPSPFPALMSLRPGVRLGGRRRKAIPAPRSLKLAACLWCVIFWISVFCRICLVAAAVVVALSFEILVTQRSVAFCFIQTPGTGLGVEVLHKWR